MPIFMHHARFAELDFHDLHSAFGFAVKENVFHSPQSFGPLERTPTSTMELGRSHRQLHVVEICLFAEQIWIIVFLEVCFFIEVQMVQRLRGSSSSRSCLPSGRRDLV